MTSTSVGDCKQQVVSGDKLLEAKDFVHSTIMLEVSVASDLGEQKTCSFKAHGVLRQDHMLISVACITYNFKFWKPGNFLFQQLKGVTHLTKKPTQPSNYSASNITGLNIFSSFVPSCSRLQLLFVHYLFFQTTRCRCG